MKTYKISYKDNVVPVYQWMFSQKEMVLKIQTLRETILGSSLPYNTLVDEGNSLNNTFTTLESWKARESISQYQHLKDTDQITVMAVSADL